VPAVATGSSRLTRLCPPIRSAAAIATGTFALHQLRYLAAYGHDSGEALARQGHGYLTDLLPALAALALAALAATLIRALAPPAASSSRQTGRPAWRIAAYAGAILAAYASQELAEGWLAAGHPAGAAALAAHGGWVALPLAIGLGAITAAGIAALERAEELVGSLVARRVVVRPPRRDGRARRSRGVHLATRPLAFGIARRPPPAALRA
jgi:hypothetical protein